MSTGLIGFLATTFVGLTLLNHLLEGAFFSSTEVGILNQMSIISSYDLGIFSIPIPNTSYITGILHLIKWDYSFFGGNAGIIQFFLYSITFAVMVTLIFTLIGVIAYQISRRL